MCDKVAKIRFSVWASCDFANMRAFWSLLVLFSAIFVTSGDLIDISGYSSVHGLSYNAADGYLYSYAISDSDSELHLLRVGDLGAMLDYGIIAPNLKARYASGSMSAESRTFTFIGRTGSALSESLYFVRFSSPILSVLSCGFWNFKTYTRVDNALLSGLDNAAFALGWIANTTQIRFLQIGSSDCALVDRGRVAVEAISNTPGALDAVKRLYAFVGYKGGVAMVHVVNYTQDPIQMMSLLTVDNNVFKGASISFGLDGELFSYRFDQSSSTLSTVSVNLTSSAVTVVANMSGLTGVMSATGRFLTSTNQFSVLTNGAGGGGGSLQLAVSSFGSQCRAGYYGGVGSSACNSCPIGMYTPLSNRTSCWQCVKPGAVSTGTDCVVCAGTLAAIDHACVPCPAGSYCNAGIATLCEENTYSTGNASVCTSCANRLGSGRGAVECYLLTQYIADVVPDTSSVHGGVFVTITGVGLSNDGVADVTQVTLCDANALVVRQNSTELVVIATVSAYSSICTVTVFSAARGLTRLVDAFTYLPGLSLATASGATVLTEGSSLQFVVELDVLPRSGSVVVTASSTCSIEVFTIVMSSARQLFTITRVSDGIAGTNSACEVTVQTTSTDLLFRNLITAMSVTIQEADVVSAVIRSIVAAQANLSAIDGLALTEGGNVTVFMSLSVQPVSDVMMHFAVDGVTLQTVVASLLFTNATWNTPQSFTLFSDDNSALDGARWDSMTVSLSSTGDTTLSPAREVPILVLDDEQNTPIIVTSPYRNTTSESGQTSVLYLLQRSFVNNAPRVSISVSPVTEAYAQTTSLTFTNAMVGVLVPVVISGRDDEVRDGDTAFTVAVDVQTGTGNSVSHTISTFSLVNVDNDWAGFNVSKSMLVVDETGSQDTVVIRLLSRPLSAVQVLMETSANITVTPSRFNVTAAQWSSGTTVTVTGMRDQSPSYVMAQITLRAISDDPVYNALSTVVNVTIRDIFWPEVMAFAPEIYPLSGNNGLLRIVDATPTLNVTFSGITASKLSMVLVSGQVYVVNQQPVLEHGSVVYLYFQSPQSSAVGYKNVTIRNSDGGFVTLSSAAYYSNDCPYIGFVGSGSACSVCPSGATCPGGNRIFPQVGYWTTSVSSGSVAPCPFPSSERCLGGATSSCGAGYDGVQCSLCASGHYRGDDGSCSACESTVVVALLMLAQFAFVALVAAVLMFSEHLSVFRFMLLGFRTIWLTKPLLFGTGALPEYVSWVGTVVNIFVGDFASARLGCNGLNTFTQVWAVNISVPLGVLIPVILVCYFRYRFTLQHAIAANVNANTDDLKTITHWHFVKRCFEAGNTMLAFCFAVVATLGVNALECTSVNNESRLIHELNTLCLAGSHIGLFAVSITLLLVLALAYPATAVVLSYKRQHDVKLTEVADAMAESFSSDFKDGWFWFGFASLLCVDLPLIVMNAVVEHMHPFAAYIVMLACTTVPAAVLLIVRPYRVLFKNLALSFLFMLSALQVLVMLTSAFGLAAASTVIATVSMAMFVTYLFGVLCALVYICIPPFAHIVQQKLAHRVWFRVLFAPSVVATRENSMSRRVAVLAAMNMLSDVVQAQELGQMLAEESSGVLESDFMSVAPSVTARLPDLTAGDMEQLRVLAEMRTADKQAVTMSESAALDAEGKVVLYEKMMTMLRKTADGETETADGETEVAAPDAGEASIVEPFTGPAAIEAAPAEEVPGTRSSDSESNELVHSVPPSVHINTEVASETPTPVELSAPDLSLSAVQHHLPSLRPTRLLSAVIPLPNIGEIVSMESAALPHSIVEEVVAEAAMAPNAAATEAEIDTPVAVATRELNLQLSPLKIRTRELNLKMSAPTRELNLQPLSSPTLATREVSLQPLSALKTSSTSTRELNVQLSPLKLSPLPKLTPLSFSTSPVLPEIPQTLVSLKAKQELAADSVETANEAKETAQEIAGGESLQQVVVADATESEHAGAAPHEDRHEQQSAIASAPELLIASSDGDSQLNANSQSQQDLPAVEVVAAVVASARTDDGSGSRSAEGSDAAEPDAVVAATAVVPMPEEELTSATESVQDRPFDETMPMAETVLAQQGSDIETHTEQSAIASAGIEPTANAPNALVDIVVHADDQQASTPQPNVFAQSEDAYGDVGHRAVSTTSQLDVGVTLETSAAAAEDPSSVDLALLVNQLLHKVMDTAVAESALAAEPAVVAPAELLTSDATDTVQAEHSLNTMNSPAIVEPAAADDDSAGDDSAGKSRDADITPPNADIIAAPDAEADVISAPVASAAEVTSPMAADVTWSEGGSPAAAHSIATDESPLASLSMTSVGSSSHAVAQLRALSEFEHNMQERLQAGMKKADLVALTQDYFRMCHTIIVETLHSPTPEPASFSRDMSTPVPSMDATQISDVEVSVSPFSQQPGRPPNSDMVSIEPLLGSDSPATDAGITEPVEAAVADSDVSQEDDSVHLDVPGAASIDAGYTSDAEQTMTAVTEPEFSDDDTVFDALANSDSDQDVDESAQPAALQMLAAFERNMRQRLQDGCKRGELIALTKQYLHLCHKLNLEALQLRQLYTVDLIWAAAVRCTGSGHVFLWPGTNARLRERMLLFRKLAEFRFIMEQPLLFQRTFQKSLMLVDKLDPSLGAYMRVDFCEKLYHLQQRGFDEIETKMIHAAANHALRTLQLRGAYEPTAKLSAAIASLQQLAWLPIQERSPSPQIHLQQLQASNTPPREQMQSRQSLRDEMHSRLSLREQLHSRLSGRSDMRGASRLSMREELLHSRLSMRGSSRSSSRLTSREASGSRLSTRPADNSV
eukprot:TRINITY_DN7216_c0_g6_i1.p1 TRINITY_DN7216_c0_g6~~TRINITY_DN7216_c0_g6_i1.p1  ORF type:complete len:2790 (+),score=706.46 TRINITY_DN7216_c0_g6_i1:973-9342(+)